MDMLTTTSSDQEPIENGASGSSNNNIINNNYFNSVIKEHMFDKLLTPSDVGKLNRIVIPKQHAENYFPLEDNQTGMSLDFQDRNGKMWRIKYSYWNSSQSYVMTKGWSRFVKDKKLDTGDTVSFHRAYVPDNSEPENPKKILFIDWRHKAEITHHHYPIFGSPAFPTAGYYPVPEYSMPHYRSFQEREFLGYGYGNGGRYYAGSPLDHHHQWNLGRSEQSVYDSYPVFPTPRVISSSSAMLLPSPPSQPPQEGTTAKKQIRLFGVDVGESSSGETRGEMGVAGYSPYSPVMIRDDESPHGEMGASSSSASPFS